MNDLELKYKLRALLDGNGTATVGAWVTADCDRKITGQAFDLHHQLDLRGYVAVFEYLVRFGFVKRRNLKPRAGIIDYDIHIDLAFPRAKLAIEVDGPIHRFKRQKAIDRERDESMQAIGWKVERIENGKVDDHRSLDIFLDRIISLINERKTI